MISKNVAKYCKDFTKIENYSRAVLDTSQKWECHHRLETHYLKGGKWIKREEELSPKKLKEDNLYFDRPPEELIFLTREEHYNKELWHNRDNSEDCKRKISETLKGHIVSEETKEKISNSVKETLAASETWKEGRKRATPKIAEKRKLASKLYKEYKANGGTLKWNEWNHQNAKHLDSSN